MDVPLAPPAPRAQLTVEQTEQAGAAPCRGSALHAGDICPACGAAKMDYNGLLDLACPRCGYSQGGSFT